MHTENQIQRAAKLAEEFDPSGVPMDDTTDLRTLAEAVDAVRHRNGDHCVRGVERLTAEAIAFCAEHESDPIGRARRERPQVDRVLGQGERRKMETGCGEQFAQ